jgi:hypothetical protein
LGKILLFFIYGGLSIRWVAHNTALSATFAAESPAARIATQSAHPYKTSDTITTNNTDCGV